MYNLPEDVRRCSNDPRSPMFDPMAECPNCQNYFDTDDYETCPYCHLDEEE